MNKENNNHILIEVLNNDGYLKLTKFRNPQAIWQNNDYPDEYVFRDVDTVNVFQLIQENKQLKERTDKAIEYILLDKSSADTFSKREDTTKIIFTKEELDLLEILKGEE